ncbi:uncharacterized protein LOC26535167 isoform X2 [Drosophila yakuba]|uniref:Uncharacterized protein, isoform A n=1 Tax=Drosophila yakuba TaxID=7245 RepID=A0A0R1EI35_DROYA|nr:uncharacterized protein LOC26535167 isoform X2 [Drosophila yakuba]KRK07089.1 uncharacterized protein Dyak_GE27986, isoform A [Drosophila yakuba]
MTVKLHFFVAFLTFSTYYLTEVYSLVEFTNVQCESVDKDYTLFPYCYLKSVNRSYKYVSVKAKLLQLPVAKAKVRLALYKRLNGYKPFLYDMTIDACRFLKYPKSNPVALYFFQHDIVLDKMSYHSINNKLTKVLPFPEGNYMFEMHWMAYDINRAITKFYFSLS